MPALVSELVTVVRQKANVERSNFVSDDEIVGYLDERRKQLQELLIAADDSYYMSRATLTTIGATVDTNSAVLPTDFWKMRGLSAKAGLREEFPVFARNFANRLEPGELGYTLDGDSISLWQPVDAAQCNPFVLRYAPRALKLALPVAYAIPATAAADGTNAAQQFVFPAGVFDDETGMTGGTLVIAGDTALGALDGSYTVRGFTHVGGDTQITVTPVPVASHIMTGPYTAVLTYQPSGTAGELDATADDYAEYLTSGAAVPVLSKKRQPDAAAARLAECTRIELRISQAATMRQSEPKSAPVLRRYDRFDPDDGRW